MLRPSALALLFGLATPSSALGQSWTGSVRDIRTDAPIAGARACAGILGRVDLACGTSKADGTFDVAYPSGSKPGSDNLYYLYIEPPSGAPYYAQVRARAAPRQTKCQLVPKTAYFRAKIVKAENGLPISGLAIALIQPGRVDHSVTTDAQGIVSFKPVTAYTNLAAQFNTFGVPKEDLPPKSDGPLEDAVWGCQAPYDPHPLYAQVKPKTTADQKFAPPLPVISSASPDLYTSALIRLPAAGTTVDDPAKYMSTSSGAGPAWNDAGRSASDLGPGVRADAGAPVLPDGGGSPRGDAAAGSGSGGGSSGCTVAAQAGHEPRAAWLLLLAALGGCSLLRRVGRRDASPTITVAPAGALPARGWARRGPRARRGGVPRA